MRSFSILFAVAAAALAIAGCATIPEPLAGEYADVTPDQSSDSHIGQRMRWGGRIVDTRPGTNETCMEILSRPLDKKARPADSDQHHGRFLACRSGFEDPAIFDAGRDITVIGQLTGFVEGHIGEFNYVYPRISADTLFLWSDPQPMHYYHDPFWYDPWYGPYPRWRFSGRVIIAR